MSKVWVLGGHGLVGEALQKAAPGFYYPKRAEFELGRSLEFPFQKDDIIIDLIPTPSPRMHLNLDANEYHNRFTLPHLDFIRHIEKTGIKKYIFLSSGGAIYGKNEKRFPLTETNPLEPISYYGESKKEIEKHIRESGLTFTILRPSNVFNSIVSGKKQSGLIGVFQKQFSQNLPVDIFGAMTITKDYIASEDVARAVILSLDKADNEIVNVGSGKGYSIAEIINSLEKHFQYRVPINMKPAIPNDIQWMVLDVSKAKKLLAFSSQIDVRNWIETNTNQQS